MFVPREDSITTYRDNIYFEMINFIEEISEKYKNNKDLESIEKDIKRLTNTLIFDIQDKTRKQNNNVQYIQNKNSFCSAKSVLSSWLKLKPSFENGVLTKTRIVEMISEKDGVSKNFVENVIKTEKDWVKKLSNEANYTQSSLFDL